jgi:hypothetical protein
VNPVITAELREWRGRNIFLRAKQIHDMVDDLMRQYIDLKVEAEFKRSSTKERACWIPRSLLVSRDLLDLVTEQADDEIVFPPER